MVFPAVYIILGSFKSNAELLVGGTKLFPSEWRVDNYTEAWQQANFARYTMNSVFLALGVMVLSLISSTMAGYVFSRKEFRGKGLIYGLFLAFMFINVGSVSLRPLFELAVRLYGGSMYAYYFDLPFEETVRRHGTKPNCGDFGPEDMRAWWREKDFSDVTKVIC